MQWLVLQFPVGSMEDYDAVVAIEDRLLEELDVDGHDTGGGVMQVFTRADDAPAAFARAQELVGDDPLAERMRAGYRDEDSDDFTRCGRRT